MVVTAVAMDSQAKRVREIFVTGLPSAVFSSPDIISSRDRYNSVKIKTMAYF
jgi:hypothetical protein